MFEHGKHDSMVELLAFEWKPTSDVGSYGEYSCWGATNLIVDANSKTDPCASSMQEARPKTAADIANTRLGPDMREGGAETKPGYSTIEGGVGHLIAASIPGC